MSELDPVTFPIDESAVELYFAAIMLEKVSGHEVPIATNVRAVMPGGMPTEQPNMFANSPTIAVIKPTDRSANGKVNQPYM